MRCDFLNAVFNIKSSVYLPLTWKRQYLFLSETRINPELSLTDKLDIVRFDHSHVRSNVMRDKSTADNACDEFTADGLGHAARTSSRTYDLASKAENNNEKHR